jgi:predicted dehydrogenase
MNRRQFLTATVATTATLAAPLPTPLRAAEARRIKAGFLGGAHSHAGEKWRLVRASDQYELVGMTEEAPAVRAQYVKPGAKFLNAEALLAQSEVVFVESAVAQHAQHARQALAAGKHVHVEKPPADNWADMEELVRLARRHNVVMQVGYMWRYHPGFAAIFEAVRQGWLGRSAESATFACHSTKNCACRSGC